MPIPKPRDRAAMSDQSYEPPALRTAGDQPAAAAGPAPAYGVNELAELVVDLLSATELVPADKLALVRGRAQQGGSLAQALVDEGVASADGIARMLAARHQLPLVDLALSGVKEDATRLIPLHVLERVAALPYQLDGDTLHVAVADPADLHGLDQLRLATPHRVEIGVASREDILREIGRISRAAEAFGNRAVLEEEAELELVEEDDSTDLEADDGVSDAPLVRLVNSVLF